MAKARRKDPSGSPTPRYPISRALLLSVLMLALLSTAFAFGFFTLLRQTTARPLREPSHAGAQHAPDRLGAVASESTICSNIGIEQLQKGGNAADSMVATVFCVGVIGMYHSGIGGGGFMIVRGSNGSYEDIDFRETMDASGYQDMYNKDKNASILGGLASGVPGEVRGLAHLHQSYGKLPWKQVMEGAISVARNGWPVSEDLVRYMNYLSSNFLVEDPNWAVDFAPNGTLVGLGDIITRQRYADTLETIAGRGPEEFYVGKMAQQMVEAVQNANGTMTMEDLKNYTVAIRKPAQITYRGYKLTSNSAPSSGEVALAVMKIVEGFDNFFDSESTNLSTHRLDEAIRFGYGRRTVVGDPSFVKGMAEFQQEMLSARTAAEIRSKISDQHTQDVSAYDPNGLESKETPGTSHVVTADASGLAISLTTTINLLFGSQVIVPETGVIMNDENNDFSIPHTKNEFGYVPSEANYIRPGKRPMSSITPVIVEYPDGKLYYVVGAAGGSRIITATIQALVNVLDRNMTAPEALSQPRLHDQLIPNVALFEDSYDNSTVDFMKGRGHNVSWMGPGSSSAQGIRILPNGTFEAAGEPRQVNSGGYAI